jgi:LysR family transcriptional regulator, low CO2-responsive transcriptional regulator
MELNHLKYFYVVARERSFTRAAKTLRVQQPTISKMVRNLESQLRLVLFERHKQGVHLTQAGSEVFEACEEIFGRVETIRLVTDQKKGECEGSLTFGATDSVCSYLVPKALGGYLRQNPKVRPSVFAGNSNLILNEIQDSRIEFGLSFTSPDFAGFHTKDLIQVPFELVIATSELKNPQIRRSFIISRDIDYPKARPFPVLEMLRRNKVKVETLISSNNLDAQKQLVKEGLGVALLPGFMVKAGLEKGNLTSLFPRKQFSYSLKLVHRKGKILSKNATVFLESFQSIAPDLVERPV